MDLCWSKERGRNFRRRSGLNHLRVKELAGFGRWRRIVMRRPSGAEDSGWSARGAFGPLRRVWRAMRRRRQIRTMSKPSPSTKPPSWVMTGMLWAIAVAAIQESFTLIFVVVSRRVIRNWAHASATSSSRGSGLSSDASRNVERRAERVCASLAVRIPSRNSPMVMMLTQLVVGDRSVSSGRPVSSAMKIDVSSSP